jgi:putative phosphonate metabolism protein
MSPGGLRAALYWAPERTDTLCAAGNAWLGRDPELGAVVPQPPLAGILEITEAPRVYGFHATLRPPMRLATGWDEFMDAAERLAASLRPFDLPPLSVRDMDGFLALGPRAASPALQALADACVRETEPHRLPPTPAELARRRAAGLSPEEERLLQRWGYPYVMQCWRFHMTLSRRLPPKEMAAWQTAAEDHFAAALAVPRRVEDIAVFTQRSPDAPFLIAHRLKLGG